MKYFFILFIALTSYVEASSIFVATSEKRCNIYGKYYDCGELMFNTTRIILDEDTETIILTGGGQSLVFNIIKVFDMDIDEDGYYFIKSYVEIDNKIIEICFFYDKDRTEIDQIDIEYEYESVVFSYYR